MNYLILMPRWSYQFAIACAYAIGDTQAVYIYTRMLAKTVRVARGITQPLY